MKKVLSLLLGLFLCVALFAGCTSSSTWANVKDNSGQLKIAVIGPEKYMNARQDFFKGMDLAVEEIKNSGIDMSYEKIYDDGSYDNGREVAKNVAENTQYALAFTFQDFDVVDAAASEFENAKKPLIIVDGSNDSTMLKSYDYVLNAFMSGESMGQAMGSYIASHNYKWVAGSHSNTNFEKAVMEGLMDKLDNSKSNLVDLECGPFNALDFSSTYDKWAALSVDCIAFSVADISWPPEFIKLVRENAGDVPIITDNIGNWASLIKDYGQYLEGVIMVAPYPIKESNSLTTFQNKYKTKYSEDCTNRAVQGYDITNMVIDRIRNTLSALDFMKNMKSSTEYQGASTVLFNSNGTLQVSNYQYLKITNGTTVLVK